LNSEAHGARWSSQPSKLPFEPFAGFEGGFDSHSLPPTSDPTAMSSGLNANPAGLLLKEFAF